MHSKTYSVTYSHIKLKINKKNKLESTHRVQTSAKEFVLVHNVKLVHSIEVRLFTEIVSIIELTLSEPGAYSC